VSRRTFKRRNGKTLIDILLTVAILGIVLGIAVPHGLKVRRRVAMQSAVGEARSVLLFARVRAAARDAGAGVRFVEIDGVWHHILYDDGDGDGLRLDDIINGVDPPAAPPLPVLSTDVVAIDRVNDPALCVFEPDGSASPCVISIVDGEGNLEVVTQRGLS
jgi:Tfp pilus assembly protein FimT